MGARAQTHLPALAVALLLLTTVAGLGIALAEGAFAGAERQPGERRVAVALSDRLVSADGSLTRRANVLNETAVRALTVERLRDRYPVVGDRAVRVRLDGRSLVSAGSTTGGTTIRRIVLVGDRQSRSYEPGFDGTDATTLPRRTDTVRLRIDPPNRTAVETVRANGRVVLHNASGLHGTFTVDASRFETTRLRFAANRTLGRGDVRVTYFPLETTKAILEVTVGA
jgi:hypothetical protein